MTWFKVDDGFWSHPKTLTLSKGAVALWVRSGSYAGQHLTDGVISRHVLPILQGNDDEAAELVAAGLWLDHIEGYLFHDWHKYQPTKDKVEGDRARTAERVAAWRGKKKDYSPSLLDNPPRPDPTRPPYAVTPQGCNAVTNGVTDSFNEFWSAYPRKAGKGAAKTAFTKALNKADASTIIAAAEAYRDDPNRQDQFTAHASTWLNQERWEDGPLPERQDSSAATRRMTETQRLMEWAAQQDAQARLEVMP